MILSFMLSFMIFPVDTNGKKNLPATQETQETGLGSSPGGGNSNPLQYYCLENLMDRGDWRATVQGVTKS